MARRRPGGQPGNKNAAGPRRGRVSVFAGKAGKATRDYAKSVAVSQAQSVGARGVTLRKQVGGVELRANISIHKASRDSTASTVIRGARMPRQRRQRRGR